MFFAGLTGVAGLGLALGEIREQSYRELGLGRNLRITIWDQATDWLLLGLLCGAIYGIFSLARVAIGRAMARRGWEPRSGWLCGVALTAGMILLASHPEFSAQRRWGLAVAVLAWCASVTSFPKLNRIPRLAVAARGAGFATLAIPSLLAARVLCDTVSLSALARQPEGLAAGLLALLLIAWIVARPVGVAGTFDPLLDARRWPGALPGLALLGCGLAALGGSDTLRAGNPQNVVLIAVDTLRLDRTSLTGGEGLPGRTPNLGAWSATGTVFTTAISQAPWTMPAFASVLTGKYPRQHGAVSLSGSLRKRETTIAEILRESGYWTGAVVSHVYVDSHHGFAQGFDVFDEDHVRGHRAITSEGVSDRALELLDQRGDEPFFLFLHYFDPHSDYRNHSTESLADDYAGWLRDTPSVGGLRNLRHLLSDDDVDHLRNLYDEEIAFTDAQIGRVLARLEEPDLQDATAVVFVSDHGEELLERGWLGHTIHLHDELIRVPLVMALPGVGSRIPLVEDPVETRAIPATLVDYLEIDPEPTDRSQSLLPAIRGEAGEPGSAYSEVWLPDAPADSGKRLQISTLRTGSWKLIRDHRRASTQLFNLVDDPGETRDVSLEAPGRVALLDERLDQLLASMSGQPVTPTREMSPELEEKLEALGYLGE